MTKFCIQGRGGFGKKGHHRDNPASQGRYPTIVKQNEKLEKHYNTLLDLPDEERAEFWEALRRDLPSSFRFCGSKGYVLITEWRSSLATNSS